MNSIFYLVLAVDVLAVAGLTDALYLTFKYLRKDDTKCVIFPANWCQIVSQSRQSRTFGIPNAMLGVVFYMLVISSASMFLRGLAPLWPLALLTAVGFAFSLYFTGVQSMIIKAFCTYCVISAAISFFMFGIMVDIIAHFGVYSGL